MDQIITKLPTIQLVGITARTSNAAEMNPMTAKIGATMQRFFIEGVQSKINHRKNPGKVFAVYTNYESDLHGAYTYFLGEEVTSLEDVSSGLEVLAIPAQNYAKFTSTPGIMPAIVINMWQKIWSMNAAELGGERAYLADFEVYDERSVNPMNSVVDCYIGISK